MMRLLLWDISALFVVVAALAAKPLTILAALFSLHGQLVQPVSLPQMLSPVIFVARRREYGPHEEISAAELTARH